MPAKLMTLNISKIQGYLSTDSGIKSVTCSLVNVTRSHMKTTVCQLTVALNLLLVHW